MAYRTMYDSTNPFDIPQTARMVAGYTDGLYAWSFDGWKYHGAAVQVRICAVTVDMSAHVADVENGALTPAQGAQFVKGKLARGEVPTIYCSLSKVPTVMAAVRALGIADNRWLIWVADWDNNPNSLALSSSTSGNYVAHQYAGSAQTGHHYDLSAVADFWPGVESAPQPLPGPPPAPAPPPPAPPPPAPAPEPVPPSPPPSPVPSPTPPPADPGAAHQSFWDFAARVLGQDIPRLIAAILEQIRGTRNL